MQGSSRHRPTHPTGFTTGSFWTSCWWSAPSGSSSAVPSAATPRTNFGDEQTFWMNFCKALGTRPPSITTAFLDALAEAAGRSSSAPRSSCSSGCTAP
eukprot:3388615-Lingulodinium_polyedra.AAC.1